MQFESREPLGKLRHNWIEKEMITLNRFIEAKISTYPQGIRSGAGDAKYYELISDEVFIHFTCLMRIYKAESDNIE